MEYTEAEKASALIYVIDKFGEDITQDPEATAIMIEVYLDGFKAGSTPQMY